MKDLFGKKQTSVFVALPRKNAAKNTRPGKNEAPKRSSSTTTLTKMNSVAVQTTLPFTGARRNTRRQSSRTQSRIGGIFKSAGRGEMIILFLFIALLTFMGLSKIYLETEVTAEQTAVKTGHEKMKALLLEHENLMKSVTQKKDLAEIEDWARKRGMVKPDPDKIILVK